MASRLIDASKIAKKYKLGIVPHYADKDNPLLGKIKIADSHILDIQQNPLDFLFQLAECENVLSSALHGLIAADSLGIPNMRMIMSDAVIGGDYKFDDYYSAFGLTTHPRVDLRCAAEFTELASIREQYGITPEMVANICSNLLNAFPYKP